MRFWLHNRVHHWFGIWPFFKLIAASITAASPPAIAHLIYQKISAPQAFIAAAALIFLLLFNKLIDKIHSIRDDSRALASQETWVRFGDLITSVKSSATLASNKDNTVSAALGVIETYTRQITKSPKGSISVSLALYNGNGTSAMTIKHRNPGNERPTGRRLRNLDNVVGHIACQEGPHPRVVADLKLLGQEVYFSPTQSKCTYRSLVIIPITASGNGKIKGFVSIDSVKPYAFHGSIADQLVVTTEPLISHIQDQY